MPWRGPLALGARLGVKGSKPSYSSIGHRLWAHSPVVAQGVIRAPSGSTCPGTARGQKRQRLVVRGGIAGVDRVIRATS